MSSNNDGVSSKQERGQQEEKITICVTTVRQASLVQLLQREGRIACWACSVSPAPMDAPLKEMRCAAATCLPFAAGQGSPFVQLGGKGQVLGKGSAADPAGVKSNRPEQFFGVIVRCYNEQKDFDESG